MRGRFISLLAAGTATIAWSGVSAQISCQNSGYAVLYFNGIRQDIDSAFDDMRNLRKRVGTSINGQPISFELAYNQSKGAIKDIAELYIQNAKSADSSEKLSTKLDNAIATNIGRSAYIEDLRKISSPGVNAQIDNIYSRLSTSYINSYKLPPTDQDYLKHNSAVNELANARYKILFVGYSQGALFANQAFNYAKTIVGPKNVAITYIAPATSKDNIFGAYVASSNDQAINTALRGLGVTPVVPTVTIPTGTNTTFGHSITLDYLRDQTSSNQIDKMVREALISLEDIPCAITYRYEGRPFDGAFSGAPFSGSLSGTVQLTVPPAFSGTITQSPNASFLVTSQFGQSSFSGPLSENFSITLQNGVPVNWRIYMTKRYPTGSAVGTFLSWEYMEIISNGRPYEKRYFDLYGRDLETYVLFGNSVVYSGATLRGGGSGNIGRWSIIPAQ